MRYVLDTNIALYFLQGRLMDSLEDAEYFVSTITELELLCYPDLAEDEERQIKAFLSDLTVIDLTESVKERTIQFRRQFKLSLPDAIVCATASALDAVLLTNDQRLLRVPSITSRSLPIL